MAHTSKTSSDDGGKGTEALRGKTYEKHLAKLHVEMVKLQEWVKQKWLEVSMEEQTRRLEGRIDDGRKIWKLSPMDLESYSRWYDYSRARDEMFKATDTAWAPWYVVKSDDKRRARLNVITHLLSKIPYKKVQRQKVKLPKRQRARGYREPDYPFKFIPERF